MNIESLIDKVLDKELLLTKYFEEFPAFCAIHKNDRLVAINKYWEVLGWDKEEILEKSYWELIHPEDIARTKEVYYSNALPLVNRYKCKDGTYKSIKWMVNHPLKNNYRIALAFLE